VLRATSVLLAGKNIVVAGFGHCGKGVAMRAKGLGANVIVTEIKPTAALKATLEGYRVMPMDQAAKVGDVFITATGVKDVIIDRHFKVMKNGAIVCNTGHYDCEVNLVHLAKFTKRKREIRMNNEEYTLKNGRRIYVLAQGRLVNLAAAEGHPSEVMDMSFANQFMSQLRLVELHRKGVRLENGVHDIPSAQDQEIANVKLSTQGIRIDKLTPEQEAYMEDFSAGT
jgi:adenosylhomocysteinase